MRAQELISNISRAKIRIRINSFSSNRHNKARRNLDNLCILNRWHNYKLGNRIGRIQPYSTPILKFSGQNQQATETQSLQRLSLGRALSQLDGILKPDNFLLHIIRTNKNSLLGFSLLINISTWRLQTLPTPLCPSSQPTHRLTSSILVRVQLLNPIAMLKNLHLSSQTRRELLNWRNKLTPSNKPMFPKRTSRRSKSRTKK